MYSRRAPSWLNSVARVGRRTCSARCVPSAAARAAGAANAPPPAIPDAKAATSASTPASRAAVTVAACAWHRFTCSSMACATGCSRLPSTLNGGTRPFTRRKSPAASDDRVRPSRKGQEAVAATPVRCRREYTTAVCAARRAYAASRLASAPCTPARSHSAVTPATDSVGTARPRTAASTPASSCRARAHAATPAAVMAAPSARTSAAAAAARAATVAASALNAAAPPPPPLPPTTAAATASASTSRSRSGGRAARARGAPARAALAPSAASACCSRPNTPLPAGVAAAGYAASMRSRMARGLLAAVPLPGGASAVTAIVVTASAATCASGCTSTSHVPSPAAKAMVRAAHRVSDGSGRSSGSVGGGRTASLCAAA